MSASFDSRLTPARPDLAAEHLQGVVIAKCFVSGMTKEVAAPLTPLRRCPHGAAPLDTELLMGERFTVYEDKDGWAWGQAELDSYVGYVQSAHLAGLSFDATHRIAAPATHLYAQPEIKAPVRCRLSLGCRLTVLGEAGRFAEVMTRGGALFVPSVHIAPLAAWAKDYVTVAERFLGVPYLFGGRSSLGLDCSSLVQLALAEAGMSAPRNSDHQCASLGAPIGDASALGIMRRGDLVFWNSHVAIAVDERRIIHANGLAMAVSIDDAAGFARAVEASEGPIMAINRLPD